MLLNLCYRNVTNFVTLLTENKRRWYNHNVEWVKTLEAQKYLNKLKED